VSAAGIRDDVVIGQNARMRAIFEYVAQIAPGLGTVLVTGESGTGKEVVARAIHRRSRRAHQPFVAVSCAVFSDSLIESELFGHERGAFTGAISARPGRFERACGGTLFLDDIDDVPLAMQVKLLRALQNREIERLGGSRTIPVDVRVIAGTKRDLRQLVAEGRFRDDLFYRLNVLTIDLPPLRERRDDLPLYLDHFLARFCERRGVPAPPLSQTSLRVLATYDWPGNVRELENLCERLAEACTCGQVRLGCLSASVLFQDEESPADSLTSDQAPAPPVPGRAIASGGSLDVSVTDLHGRPLDDVMREIEAQIISAALSDCGGNRSSAARRLGIKRSTLGDRIQRCGLPPRELIGTR
jgi:two-component system, NtrC family, response regulator